MINFGKSLDTNFSSNAGQYLKPYGIYKVNLTKIEKTVLKGSKDPDKEYPIIALEFTGCGDDKGSFTTNLFIPNRPEDEERRVLTNSNGHENTVPSASENFQYTLMQIVHVLNPTGEEKIKANASKIKTMDQFIDLIIKALTGKDKIETNLKLIGRNSNGTIYADLPRACGLNKSGEIFPVNFIGENLFFSNYEVSQQKKYQTAKPTPVKDDDVDKEDDALDLENIEV